MDDSFLDKHFERGLQMFITLLLLIPAWLTIWYWWESNPHMILGTNIITATGGFWLGSSYGSAIKDKAKDAAMETMGKIGLNNENKGPTV